MITRPTRIVPVGTSPTLISNPLKTQVAFRALRYPSGGGKIFIGGATVSTTTGQEVVAANDFMDLDQSLERYAVTDTGTVNLSVTDYEA